MATFQLPHSRLFPNGTQLFVSGDKGLARLVIQLGKQVTLELRGLNSSAASPTIRQVPLQSASDLLGLVFPAMAKGPDVVAVSTLSGSGPNRTFTLKAVRPGAAALLADGTSPIGIIVGDFKNHPEFDIDLIADVFRSSDPAKMHVLTRMLFSNWDNLFNEDSEDNQRHWCPGYPANPCLPCGTVSKVGSTLIFHPVEYDYQIYYKRLTGMGNATARAAFKREDIKYDETKLKQGCDAIKKRLVKGMPSVVGLVYIPASAIRAGGELDTFGTGGHSVPIVGCDTNATRFLYIDVYPDGSKLKYTGGHAGRDLFPNECTYLGVFELVDDPVRGTPVLRARPGTAGPSGIFDGDQFLEVTSGPLRA